jgi:hypothetical protein
MTFTAGQPENGQSLGASKVPIRDNFTAIVADLGVNHVAINLADQGKHKFLQMPEQGSAPTTAANEGGLYTKVGPSPAQTQLFYRAESSGFEYQMTQTIAASTALFATDTNYIAPATTLGGWTFLPGGLLLQYGTIVPTSTPGFTAVAYPVTFPSGNPAFCIQITATTTSSNGDQTASLRAGTSASTGFSINTSSSGNVTLFNWIAIGN